MNVNNTKEKKTAVVCDNQILIREDKFQNLQKQQSLQIWQAQKELESYLLFLAMGRSLLTWPCNTRFMSVQMLKVCQKNVTKILNLLG